MKISLDPTKVGMHHGVQFEDYLKIDAVSKSILWKLHITSPAGMKHWQKHPPDPTDAMVLGSMVDTRVSEGLQGFHDRFCRIPPMLRRDHRSKKYQEFLTACGQRKPVKAVHYDKVSTIFDRLWEYPLAHKRIHETARQLTLVWEIEIAGQAIKMKGRPDFVAFINDGPELCDLKVTNSVKPEKFSKSILNFGYHWQAAIYLDGFNAVQDQFCSQFSFIVVEDSPPFGVEVFKLSQRAIELGRAEYKQTLSKYLECQEKDNWPASSGQIQIIDLPKWVYPREETNE